MWQIRGQEVEDFIVAAQDRSKNAHSKSMLAAYNSWIESLRSDQAQFESQRILIPGCIYSLGKYSLDSKSTMFPYPTSTK